MRTGRTGSGSGMVLKKTLALAAATSLLLATGAWTAACGTAAEVSPAEISSAGPQSGAGTGSTTGPASTGTEGSAGDTAVITYSEARTVTYDEEDLDATWNRAKASFITLEGESVSFVGVGAAVNGNKVTIRAGGTYVVSGSSSDAQIVVDLDERGLVKLVLAGASLACADSAPIYVKRADKTVIVLAEGTQNLITDGSSYANEPSSDEPDAAVFSKDDLTINGTGSLTVRANYNNGIVSKDDLKIASGNIIVEAANDAVKGRDSVGVKDATLTITAGGDGIQANNDADAGKGFVDIQGGHVRVTADGDGIQACATLCVGQAAEIVVSTGGGSASVSKKAKEQGFGGPGFGQRQSFGGQDQSTSTTGTTVVAEQDSGSAKGLKAAGGVFIEGGQITVDSADDSVHSDGDVQVRAGTLALSSGDDGIHAEGDVELGEAQVSITDSYEGVEGTVVTVNGAVLRIRSSDDGINVAGGNDGSAANGPMGADAFAVNENNGLYINGGYIVVDADGDGIDCNGRIFMKAGTVIVNGPTENMNGAIDYLGEFTVSGGFLVAVGSAGMAEAPSESSSQPSLMINLDSVQAAGTLVHLEDEDGTDVLTFAPTKQYQSIVVCSPELKQGSTYTLYLGGSHTGTLIDGVYSDGVYTAGTKTSSLTLSGMVTVEGSSGMMPGNGGLPGGPGGGTAPGSRGRNRGSVPGRGVPGNFPSSTTTVPGS